MKTTHTLDFPDQELARASKIELIKIVLEQRTEILLIKTENEIKISALKEQLAEKEAELEKIIKKNINITAN